MDKHEKTVAQIGQGKLVPVITIDRAEDASPLAEALILGGLPVAEVTMRTPVALQAMEVLASYSDVILGAGTVLTADQVDQAVDHGASYIIAPGMHEAVVERCLELEVLVIPGVITPSDIAKAMSYHLELVKFFPAESFGGASTLKAMAAPYQGMRFVPTGGINAGNLTDYLEIPAVLACGGSWMVDRQLIHAGEFSKLQNLIIDAVKLANKSKV